MQRQQIAELTKSVVRDVPNPSDCDAETLAVEVFEMVQQFKTPPVPEAYKVLYAYASKQPPEISHRIDEIVSRNGVLKIQDVNDIYKDLNPYPLSNYFKETNKIKIAESELLSIIKIVEMHLLRNEKYSNSLSSMNNGLTSVISRQEFRKIIDRLLIENEESQIRKQELTKQLASSQSRIRDMREQLTKARDVNFQDGLTSLSNRLLFEAQLSNEIAAAHENQCNL